MSRDAVVALLARIDVPRETIDRLDTFVDKLREEAARQNLVSKSTLETVWTRHILDSLQLLAFAPSRSRTWLDIGAGAGLPGLVVAAAGRHRVTLVEPRRMRCEFLERASAAIGTEVEIIQGKAESVTGTFDVISARAVAPLSELLAWSHPLAHAVTRLIFPKGRSGAVELEAVQGTWQGDFRIEPSITDAASAIVVAERVEPKGKR